jgi:ElaB/YqjD/DUF883 family membrane-anchored ribosome-binding protein
MNQGKLNERLNRINGEIKKLNNRLSRLNSWKATTGARNYAAARAKNASNYASARAKNASNYASARANNVRRAALKARNYVANAPRKAGSGFFGRLARMGNYARTQQQYYKSIKPAGV